MENEIKCVAKELAHIQKVLEQVMTGKGISFSVVDLSNKHNKTINIEPKGYDDLTLDGMQIIYENGIYEVSEYQAGKNANELHIYLETKSFKVALTNMLKGNGRKPIKIWD